MFSPTALGSPEKKSAVAEDQTSDGEELYMVIGA